ncbi:MAG: hypothetical protein AAF349_21935, partial [Cyanobacteria bacterium P01_A01_bin.68]
MKIKLHFSDKLSSPFSVKPDKNYKNKAMRKREVDGERDSRKWSCSPVKLRRDMAMRSAMIK